MKFFYRGKFCTVAISNKACGGSNILKAFGIAALTVLILVGVTGASPFAYIADLESNNVSVIDTATNIVTATVNMGNEPAGVAVNPDGTRVYVTNCMSNSVSVIDAAKNKVIDTVYVGSYPYGVAITPDKTKVYVANVASNTISLIDTATNNVTATVKVENLAYKIAVAPDGNKLYALNHGIPPDYQGTVSVINIATNTITTTVNVEKDPRGIVVSPDGTKVYVVNSNGYPYYKGTVSVIDTATNNVIATVPVGNSPQGIAVSPDGTKLYVTIGNPGRYPLEKVGGVTAITGAVDVIDTAKNEFIGRVGVGSAPQEVAVTPDGNEVYVVNSGSNTTSIIDTATNKVNATVPVGRSPVAVGTGPATKFSSTTEPNSTSLLSPISQTENQINDTGMIANVGTVDKQEKKSIPTKAPIPFLSPIWELITIIGTVEFVRKMK
ncbi:beta-propeller fold lactonase family protein [Methanosarcina siciliae]|uniref:beta-propeller fold lactonase family protein n=1 Tax=Methanosarcina siciliae TaxID=38027 RepID=UPI000698DA4B|nr:YncE family protein [Methanosarcina siciliae]